MTFHEFISAWRPIPNKVRRRKTQHPSVCNSKQYKWSKRGVVSNAPNPELQALNLHKAILGWRRLAARLGN